MAGLEFYPSDILLNCDPIAYQVGYEDWADGQITELEDELEQKEEELKGLLED